MRITKPTLRTERESALLGKRFPFLLAATSSQTAVSCLEVTGVIESTSTDATGIHFAHWLGWFPSSPFLHKIICLQHSSAVGQLNTQGKSGSGASSLPTSTIFQQTSKHIYIIIYIYIHTHRRVHAHTYTQIGQKGKGNSWKRRFPQSSGTSSRSVPPSSVPRPSLQSARLPPPPSLSPPRMCMSVRGRVDTAASRCF